MKDFLIRKCSIFLCIILLSFLCINIFTGTDKTYRHPKSYSKALKIFSKDNDISHFPANIPANAKNIQFYAFISNFNGKVMLLKFDVNKEYIEKELKNHQFFNDGFPVGSPQQIYFMPSDNGRIKSDNMTFYVINNEKNKAVFDKYFPYFSGIGVNKSLNKILYYYIEPDD